MYLKHRSRSDSSVVLRSVTAFNLRRAVTSTGRTSWIVSCISIQDFLLLQPSLVPLPVGVPPLLYSLTADLKPDNQSGSSVPKGNPLRSVSLRHCGTLPWKRESYFAEVSAYLASDVQVSLVQFKLCVGKWTMNITIDICTLKKRNWDVTGVHNTVIGGQ
jgi:hypothetical protein